MRRIRIIVYVIAVSLFFTVTPATQPFITRAHLAGFFAEVLIQKIEAPHWTVGYRFATGCSDKFREKLPRLQTLTSDVLRAWLEPLQELHAVPIVDEFRFVQLKDYAGGRDDDNSPELAEIDLPITFRCESGRSFYHRWGGKISVHIRKGVNIQAAYIHAILHEIGHAFGLADTYTQERMPNHGGWTGTAGTQPAAVMAGHGRHNVIKEPPIYLAEDDIRAIQWLYKHIYEGLPVDDCFFPEYVLEPEPGGCRPKYPLIFAVKHPGALSDHVTPLMILDDDPQLDINTRDDDGYTALHYAVIQGDAELVQQMLAHPDIKTDISNNDGQTPLDLAQEPQLRNLLIRALDINEQDESGATLLHAAVRRGDEARVQLLLTHPDIKPYISDNAGNTPLALAHKAGLTAIAAMLTNHPRAFRAVKPTDKPLAVTWGELKRRRDPR